MRSVLEIPVSPADSGPYGIALGPDGALWFTLVHAGRIGCLTPAGDIREYPLPDRAAKPHAIVGDPAGGCWFTEWAANRITHMGSDGAFRHYDLPSAAAEPHGIALGARRHRLCGVGGGRRRASR